MKYLINFLKGVVVGIGGIAPGLSGSVMLIILGLYEKMIRAMGTLFKNFKKNIAFLIPLVLGFGCGVIIFSKIVDFMLTNFEFQTRYLFLGLVLGTVPLFYRQVKKRGFKKKFYVLIIIFAIVGFYLFSLNKSLFPVVTDPSVFQSALLGVAVAGSSIIPGVDSAVILSALGLYELYVSSLADLNMAILIPAAVGLAIGAGLISVFMNFLIKKYYTVTFSIIFGLFLSIIPKVLNDSCIWDSPIKVIVSILLSISGFLISFYFGDISKNNQRIKKLFNKKSI